MQRNRWTIIFLAPVFKPVQEESNANASERAQQLQKREKSVIDRLVRNRPKPKPDEKQPTTSTGLPVEDQVRKEWDPRKEGGLPNF